MPKQKIKAIIRKFLFFIDPSETKETVREMYDFIMLSDDEISTKQRKRFTLTCMQIEELMNDISSISKKVLRKKKALTI